MCVYGYTLVPRVCLSKVKLLPLALCADVFEGDETDYEPVKESESPKFIVCNYTNYLI